MAEVFATVGTAFACCAFADQCLKYGRKFVKRAKSYLNAEDEAIELLVSIESNWMKMETQIEFLKRVAPSMDKRTQDMHSQILSQLEGKLKTATLIIDQLTAERKADEKLLNDPDAKKRDERNINTLVHRLRNMKSSKKFKYSQDKASIQAIIKDIEKWQLRFDPAWSFVMTRLIGDIDGVTEEEMKRPKSQQVPLISAAKGIRDAAKMNEDTTTRDPTRIWIGHETLDINPKLIENSTALISVLGDTEERVIIDTMISNPAADTIDTTRQVRNLARTLAQVDPTTFGLMRCRGVIKSPISQDNQEPSYFKFIFSIPPQLGIPQSLRTILLSSAEYPQDERLNLAVKITSSVLFVHTIQFVHKNIRPETIIVFPNQTSEIGAPFLAGFEKFRIDEGATWKFQDNLWRQNMYRHPTRQGTNPTQKYQMQHDIYSLGVTLLEIGLWESFLLQSDDPSEELHASPLLNPVDPENLNSPLGPATRTKSRFEELARTKLPVRMGKRYTDIVLTCLKCLDKGDESEVEGFGVGISEVEDSDGIVIGVRFIENVLEKIQDICV